MEKEQDYQPVIKNARMMPRNVKRNAPVVKSELAQDATEWEARRLLEAEAGK
jgi:molybdopterin synthase catalytic subunit